MVCSVRLKIEEHSESTDRQQCGSCYECDCPYWYGACGGCPHIGQRMNCSLPEDDCAPD
jgi:hypothetical protein